MRKEFFISLVIHSLFFGGVYFWTFYKQVEFGIGGVKGAFYTVDVFQSGVAEKTFQADSLSKKMIKEKTDSENKNVAASSSESPGLTISDGGTNQLLSIEDYMRWVVAHNEAPVYPRLARQRDEQGKVIVKVTVNSEGKLIQGVILERSSGSSLLDRLSVETVKSWNFPRFVSQYMQVSFLIPIRFALK